MLGFVWSEFFQQITSGLATGAIFASLALALVLIYRTTHVVNFAQGEMATFTTYIAWTLMHHGLAYWPAFVLTLVIAFGGGISVERLLIRHDDGTPSPPGSGSLVSAALGIDNVKALPEPSGPLGLIAGAALIGAARRPRRGSHI